MIKCELVVDGYLYRITDDVMNWDDIVLSVKRGDYDGVIRSFSSKFEFVNGAHALLKNQYRNNYLAAAASVIVSRRNNSWGWNELFRCTLDFSTYEDSGNVVSINAVDDSLASLIKAKRGTQYEYSVDMIKEENQLYYDRITMSNLVKWSVVGTSNESDGSVSCEYIGEYAKPAGGTIPLGIMSTEISLNENVDFKDFAGGQKVSPYDGFFVAKKNVKVIVSLDLLFTTNSTSPNDKIRIRLYNKGVSVDNAVFYNDGKSETRVNAEFEVTVSEKMSLSIDAGSDTGKTFTVIFKKSSISCKWAEKNNNGVYINVITPQKLLNRLLQSMNGGKEGITGEIQKGYDERVDNCIIVAAESVRDIKGAKLYSSFNKFADWMNAVFGYVYDISGNKVTFRHRTKYFTDEVVKEVKEFDDFSYSVNSSLIYSQVRAGYDKQDYDSINGRDEFRFTTTFSTGVTLTDNSLDLISPYRADAYGFEFLVQKRGADTTDTDSDNDVFFVGVELVRSQVVLPGGIATILYQYELIRGGKYAISGVISPDSMFNAMYSPRSMLLSNKEFIGCGADRLTYTSSEGNSDAVIGGLKEKDDVIISTDERIITVGELSFSTPEYDIPDNQHGLVMLTRNGEKYVGYIQKADINMGREECTKFALSVKRIE